MSRRSPKTNAELTYRGVVYKSGLEVDIAKLLYKARTKLKKSFKFHYEQDSFNYQLKEREYIPDFSIYREDGSLIFIEVKGHLDTDAQKKMIAVKRCNPDDTFVLLFSKDSLIRKGRKMRYSGWCERNNFDYAIGEVPERWLKVS